MSSRYKFRAYSFHSNMMEYWDEEDYGTLLDGADGVEPMQFTGSQDKGGKNIWENDIVLWCGEDPFDSKEEKIKRIVGWNQRTMSYRLFRTPEEIGKSGGESFWSEDVEVIGHIYDWKNEECRYLLDESVRELRS